MLSAVVRSSLDVFHSASLPLAAGWESWGAPLRSLAVTAWREEALARSSPPEPKPFEIG
jgi:hypothetical protein